MGGLVFLAGTALATKTVSIVNTKLSFLFNDDIGNGKAASGNLESFATGSSNGSWKFTRTDPDTNRYAIYKHMRGSFQSLYDDPFYAELSEDGSTLTIKVKDRRRRLLPSWIRY